MFLVNLLTRNDTDQFTPLFEILYGIELTFILLALVAACYVIFGAANVPGIHRILRLRVIFPILIACGHLLSRVGVMHHQYFGTSEYVENAQLIFGSIMREIFLGYMTALVPNRHITLSMIVSLSTVACMAWKIAKLSPSYKPVCPLGAYLDLFRVGILALDRWVATKAWAWYESETSSTLLFFALQESILFAISLMVAFLVVNEHISDVQSIYYFAIVIVIGATCFTLVFRRNLRIMREMKRGAVINRYSVARTYQIRENIKLLTAFSQIARPLVIVCIPPFAFYPIFTNVPANIGFDLLRFFSAAMYDLWLSIASFVVFSCLPYYFSRTLERSLLNWNTTSDSRHKNTVVTAATGDAYFSLLFNDLGR